MKGFLFTKILYATDLSETAKQAERYALSLAHEYELNLLKMSHAGINCPA